MPGEGCGCVLSDVPFDIGWGAPNSSWKQLSGIYFIFCSTVATKMTEFIWRNSFISYSCKIYPREYIPAVSSSGASPMSPFSFHLLRRPLRRLSQLDIMTETLHAPPPHTHRCTSWTRPVWHIFLVAVINKFSKFYYYRRLDFFFFFNKMRRRIDVGLTYI